MLSSRSSSASFTIIITILYFDGDGWKKRWIYSEHRTDYGKFNLTYGKFFNDPEEDLGLTTSENMRYYAVSANFTKISNKNKLLIVQYAVKREFLKDFDCGGLYLKLLRSTTDQKDFHDNTPYEIMFGPDNCGFTSKIHIILRYNDSYHNSRLSLAPVIDALSHVYTLIIYPNNSIEVLVDGERKLSGDLEEHFNLLRPRKIDDPNAKKPDDWDDTEFIDDPNDKKPDDWDKPEYLVDEEAVKPNDWDDDMDGEWEPPLKKNPEFKGQWRAKRIKNPKYMGHWSPPKIDNPFYEPDPNLYLYDDIGIIGIDLWQVNAGTVFDNIIITDSVKEAQKYADLTLKIARKKEEQMKKEYDEKIEQSEEKERRELEALEKLGEDQKRRVLEKLEENKKKQKLKELEEKMKKEFDQIDWKDKKDLLELLEKELKAKKDEEKEKKEKEKKEKEKKEKEKKEKEIKTVKKEEL